MTAARKKEGHGREQFLAPLTHAMTKRQLEMVNTAYVFAKYGHHDQTRDNGKRYFEHPKSVARIIVHELEMKNDWRIIVTALLHDILEDAYLLSEYRIKRNFGVMVAHWVALLSKIPKEGYHERLKACGIWQAHLVKLCDRLDNLRDFHCWEEQRKEKYRTETRTHYVPLADTLLPLIPPAQTWRAEYLKKELLSLL